MHLENKKETEGESEQHNREGRKPPGEVGDKKLLPMRRLQASRHRETETDNGEKGKKEGDDPHKRPRTTARTILPSIHLTARPIFTNRWSE